MRRRAQGGGSCIHCACAPPARWLRTAGAVGVADGASTSGGGEARPGQRAERVPAPSADSLRPHVLHAAHSTHGHDGHCVHMNMARVGLGLLLDSLAKLAGGRVIGCQWRSRTGRGHAGSEQGAGYVPLSAAAARGSRAARTTAAQGESCDESGRCGLGTCTSNTRRGARASCYCVVRTPPPGNDGSIARSIGCCSHKIAGVRVDCAL